MVITGIEVDRGEVVRFDQALSVENHRSVGLALALDILSVANLTDLPEHRVVTHDADLGEALDVFHKRVAQRQRRYLFVEANAGRIASKHVIRHRNGAQHGGAG